MRGLKVPSVNSQTAMVSEFLVGDIICGRAGRLCRGSGWTSWRLYPWRPLCIWVKWNPLMVVWKYLHWRNQGDHSDGPYLWPRFSSFWRRLNSVWPGGEKAWSKYLSIHQELTLQFSKPMFSVHHSRSLTWLGERYHCFRRCHLTCGIRFPQQC